MSLTTAAALANSQTFGVTLLPRTSDEVSTDVLASRLA